MTDLLPPPPPPPPPPPESHPRFATASLVEPILQEATRTFLEEKSALFATPSPPPPPPSNSNDAAATEPAPLLLRYPRDPRDAQLFTSELSERLLSKLAQLSLPCKWATSCSLAARAGGGSALAAAGLFEEEGEEGGEEEEGQGKTGGDSLCSVLVEEGGLALTVTAAWVRCL